MRARTPRPNWTFDWNVLDWTGKKRGRMVRINPVTVGASRAGKTLALLDAMKRMTTRAEARQTVGRIEGCRFIEGGKVAQKKARKLTVAERVARLEEQLTPHKDGTFFSLFDRPCFADEVRYLRSEVNDLTARLGTPGVPLFIYTARLSCSTVVRIVARTIDEATAKAHAFVRYQDHDASVLSVTQEGDQVDVC